MNAPPAKLVSAQRVIATATACSFLTGVNPRTKAQASKHAEALAGIALAQPQVHTLAWVLTGRRADSLAAILTQARAEHPPT